MSSGSKKLVTIGGGVIGLSVAYFAAKLGHTPIVLDRSEEDHEGCSFRNAGLVVPSHFVPLAAPGMIKKGLWWLMNPESPFYVKPSVDLSLLRWGLLFWRHANVEHTTRHKDLLAELNFESREHFKELAKEGDFGLETRGLLMLCRTQRAFDEEANVACLANQLGMDTEVCSPARLSELDPDIEMDTCGGVFFKQDCHLDPQRFIRFLRSRIVALGGSLRYGARVDDFTSRNDSIKSVILEDGETIEGDEFVLASGTWSPELSRKVGLRLPMQSGKGYSLTLDKPAQLPRLSSILVEAKVAVTPIGQSLRFSGTMEVGAKDTRINPNRVQGIIKSAASYFPQFSPDDFAEVTPWAGLRPCSPDGIPYIGSAPRFDNLVVATGHAMMGLSLAPVTGRIVADMLSGQHLPDQRLSPSRFC